MFRGQDFHRYAPWNRWTFWIQHKVCLKIPLNREMELPIRYKSLEKLLMQQNLKR